MRFKIITEKNRTIRIAIMLVLAALIVASIGWAFYITNTTLSQHIFLTLFLPLLAVSVGTIILLIWNVSTLTIDDKQIVIYERPGHQIAIPKGSVLSIEAQTKVLYGGGRPNSTILHTLTLASGQGTYKMYFRNQKKLLKVLKCFESNNYISAENEHRQENQIRNATKHYNLLLLIVAAIFLFFFVKLIVETFFRS